MTPKKKIKSVYRQHQHPLDRYPTTIHRRGCNHMNLQQKLPYCSSVLGWYQKGDTDRSRMKLTRHSFGCRLWEASLAR